MHPEEIEHGAEEILVRGASDGDFLGVGEGGTEDGLEVLEGDMASAGIEEEGEGAEAIGEAHGAFAGDVGEGEDEEAAGEGFEVGAPLNAASQDAEERGGDEVFLLEEVEEVGMIWGCYWRLSVRFWRSRPPHFMRTR